MCHLTAACVSAQSHAGRPGESCRAMLLPRPPSFWRQNHAKPWPARQRASLTVLGRFWDALPLQNCLLGYLMALLLPIQLERQRQSTADCKRTSKCVGRSCATNPSPFGSPGSQVLRPPTVLGFTQQAAFAQEHTMENPLGHTKMVLAIRKQCCPCF